jgi:competence protein ComEA
MLRFQSAMSAHYRFAGWRQQLARFCSRLGAHPVCLAEILQRIPMIVLSALRGRLGSAAVFACFFFLVLAANPVLAQTTSAATPPQTIAQKIAASNDLLDINTATAAELKALPGMGDAYAQRIIAGRPYTAKNQLTMRGILPQTAYAKIKPLIVAHRVKP